MLRLITPPAAFLAPSDIPGAPSQALIDAVTAEIDGPNGWLGRALGPQTIEYTADAWRRDRRYRDRCVHAFVLPCPPIISITSVKYVDVDGAEQTIDTANYVLYGDTVTLKPTYSLPCVGSFADPIRVRYQAGYNGTAVASGGTGSIPAAAKQAIILLTQHLINTGAENLFLSAVEIPDVEKRQYIVSESDGKDSQRDCRASAFRPAEFHHMTPAQMIADLDEALARVGSTVALRKTNTTTGQVTVKARVRFYAPAEIAGIIEQGDSKVVLSPTGLGAFGVPPQGGFVVTADGTPRRIITPTPIYVADTLVRIELQVRG
jgi:hypothetical protein